jgi:hypothetical protein
MRSEISVFLFFLAGAGLARPAAADVVVGTGPGTCTDAAFGSAIAAINATGGTITFNCGGPATITVTSTKVLLNAANPNLVYAIDGWGDITLKGGGSNALLLHETGTLNLRNITLKGGFAQGAGDNASGGALRSDGMPVPGAAPVHLNLSNVTFTGNATNLTSAPAPTHPFDYGGGALFTRWGIVTIADCTFASNTANNSSGGALHGRASTISITRTEFSGNSSNGGGFGGAIWVDGLSPTNSGVGGTLQVSTSQFTGNTSRNQGGAISFYLYPAQSESVTFDTVSVIGNQVLDSSGTFLGTRAFGGGISGDRGDVTILNSTVANNLVRSSTGGSGGGISLGSNGAITIVNTTISNNRAEGTTSDATGGGLFISAQTQPSQITHATIAFNFATWAGGGITASNLHSPERPVTLRNTIIAGNDAATFPGYDQCDDTLTNGGGVLEFPSNTPHCAIPVVIADPLLAPLGTNGGFSPTHLLRPGSTAIDAGACVIARDERGVSRPQGPACDLGAVEVGAPPPPATSFFTLNPCRVVDTRSPSGATFGAPLICGLDYVFTLSGGSCGVPGTAKAVAANATVIQPTTPGSLNAYPAGSSRPLTAVVNYTAGSVRGNNAIVPLNGAGQVAVRCSGTGSTHAVIDVNGYFQ